MYTNISEGNVKFSQRNHRGASKMTTATKTDKQVKTVSIVARIEFKADSKKVCYIVRSSTGIGTYTTCLFNGKACSCTCPTHGLNCYHCTQLEVIEAARREAAETARC